ncbi:hypothetical protein [Serratia fonticola]|uniref:hypothetical protein n=1 Tax=Serratia fonticola TaxID=47917 RepID=UPI00217C2796|nr:hypothetical protein [Serratia fonticola]CAI1663599.1 Uncharacterised protein [Serratia fonticola]
MRWHGVSHLTWVLVGVAVWSGDGLAYQPTSRTSTADFTLNVVSEGTSVNEIGTFVVEASTVSGAVNCNYVEPASGSYNRMYHRSYIDLPWDPAVNRYRINKNLSMTYLSADVSDSVWNMGRDFASSYKCGNNFVTQQASGFTAAFPITLTFYLDRRPIDNIIPIPRISLGGYVRVFDTAAPVGRPTNYTVPYNLLGGTIVVPAVCVASALALELDHGAVTSDTISHIASQQLTYTCDNPISAKIEISYQENANGLLDLKDNKGVAKAQSRLTIMDNETGKKGREISTHITRIKTYTVSSELNNITGEGSIKGSAWIIALMD